MVLSIVHPEDASDLIEALTSAGFYVTLASTVGGFLRRGKATLLIGVRGEQVERVMDIIRENTHPRSRRGWWLRPGTHEEGAATVFVLDMEQVRLAD